MIKYQTEQYGNEEIGKILHDDLKEWFFSNFKDFTISQKMSLIPIHEQRNILISAPTGSGKTLTAFTSPLNHLMNLAESGSLNESIYIIYLSPLKALNNDIKVNVERVINGVNELRKKKGKEIFDIRVAVRTGDTSNYEKSKQLNKAPHILITTPESLSLILTSKKFVENIKNVWYVVVDEIHSLADSKRGAHLSLSLERLNFYSNFTRIGLSATVAPIEEVAKYLAGTGRSCLVVDVNQIKKYHLEIITPVHDLIYKSHEEIQTGMYTKLNDIIKEHKSTIIFTNTRHATEKIVHELKTRFKSEYVPDYEGNEVFLIDAHHGSLSRSHRLGVEENLRKGNLKATITSTSLELGIDIGAVDKVVLVSSPKGSARAMQRIGRSGHQLGAEARGTFVVTDRDDLVESSTILKEIAEKKIDKIKIPQNTLDVLAQQILGVAIERVVEEKELLTLVKRSYCYKNLNEGDFNDVLKYLAGEYFLENKNVYAKIWRNEGKIGGRGLNTRMIYMTNIGVIPDQTSIRVTDYQKNFYGMVDEVFVEQLKKGDVFVLGGKTYKFVRAYGESIVVEKSGGRPTVPVWVSEMLPLSFDTAIEISKFRRLMHDYFEEFRKGKKTKHDIVEFVSEYLHISKETSEEIYSYFKEQYLFMKIPHLGNVIIEEIDDENGKSYVFHTLFGRRVNDVLSRGTAYLAGKDTKTNVSIAINDNGFVLNSKKPINVYNAFVNLNSQNIDNIMKNAIEKTQLFVRRFRHCASRALMILRNYKGIVKSVARQQFSALILIKALNEIDPNFPILKETRREILEDFMDLENAKKIIDDMRNGKIKIERIQTKIPSPFALNILVVGFSDILKMEDRIEFIKRMHNMIIAKISLDKKE